MCHRIKKLRIALKMSQDDIGKKLGVTRAAISRLENGERNVTEQMVLAICREFNVNEKWLRTGEGEMFEKRNNVAVAKAAQLLGKKDPIFEAFVETYADLSPSDRDVLLKTSMKFLKSLEKFNSKSD